MFSRNQKGFTAIEVVLGLVLLATIGAAGYFAYQNSQKAAPATPTPTATLASAAFTVPGWKVRLALSDKLARLTPGTPAASSYSASDQTVAIYAPELDASW